MPDLSLRLGRDSIVVDGDGNTMLEREGIPSDECPLLFNILDPEMILAIHERYVLAGAQALTTNSFGGTRERLAAFGLEDKVDELNRAAVRLAKAARPEHVLASVGPCGLALNPLDDASLEAASSQYAEQITALAAEGPDAIFINSMTNLAEVRCALHTAKSVCELPIIVSCVFDERGHVGLSEVNLETAAAILQEAGTDVIGIEGELEPQQLLTLVKRMAQATALPLLVRPDASTSPTFRTGTPSVGADGFVDIALALRQAGVQLIGSGHGTTPAFTSAIYAAIGKTEVIRRNDSTAP